MVCQSTWYLVGGRNFPTFSSRTNVHPSITESDMIDEPIQSCQSMGVVIIVANLSVAVKPQCFIQLEA